MVGVMYREKYHYVLEGHLPLKQILNTQLNYKELYHILDKKDYRIKINVSTDAIRANEGKGFYKDDIKGIDIVSDYCSVKTVFEASRHIASELY